MADRFVNIFITARDLTGSVFRRVQANATALQGQFSQIGNTQSIAFGQGGLAGSLLGANLQAQALYGAINLVNRGIGAVGDAIAGGADREVGRVGAIAAAVKTLGISYQEAAEYVQDAQRAIADLGATTPTDAEKIQKFFSAIQDDFNLALRESTSGLEELQQLTVGTSSKLAILAELSGSTARNANAAIQAYLSGSLGVRGLNQYKFFSDNPLLRTTLADLLEERSPGSRSFGDLDLEERVRILIEAVGAAITDTDIQKLGDTFQARLSNFFDSLFDPEIGIFSIQRDLEPDVAGYQSVFSELGETLELLIGDRGIFAELSRLTGLQGIDPMRFLRDGIRNVNDYFSGLRERLQGIENLDAFDTGVLLGEILGELVGGIRNLMFNLIGETFKSAPEIISFIGGFAIGLLKELLVGTVTDFTTILVPKVFEGLGAIAAKSVKAVGDALYEVFIAPVEAALKPFASFGEDLGNAIVPIGSALNPLNVLDPRNLNPFRFSGQQTTTPEKQSGFFESVGNFFGNLFSPISNIFSGYDGFIPAYSGLGYAIAQEARNKPYGSNFVIANSSEAILTPKQVGVLNNALNSRRSTVQASTTNRTNNVTFQPGAFNFSLAAGTSREIAAEAIAIIEQELAIALDDSL